MLRYNMGVVLGPLENTIQLLNPESRYQAIQTIGRSFRLRPERIPKEWFKILP